MEEVEADATAALGLGREGVEHQDAAAAELQLTRPWQRRKRNRGRRGTVWRGGCWSWT